MLEVEALDPLILTQYRSPDHAAVAVEVSIGHASDACGALHNDDFFGSVTPQDERVQDSGILLAIADGLSGGAGRAAAESLVYSVLSDYYTTPAGMATPRALGTVVEALNRWLYAQNCKQAEGNGMLSTLSVLVLRGSRFDVAHVGDTRIYHLCDGRLQRLTADHLWRTNDLHHVLRRAVGLDDRLLIDYAAGEARAGDVFIMISDGVWSVLEDGDILKVLEEHANPQKAASVLVEKAVLLQSLYMGTNNATAAVIRIDRCSP